MKRKQGRERKPRRGIESEKETVVLFWRWAQQTLCVLSPVGRRRGAES